MYQSLLVGTQIRDSQASDSPTGLKIGIGITITHDLTHDWVIPVEYVPESTSRDSNKGLTGQSLKNGTQMGLGLG